ncbi:MAG: transporter substrate-binding domain-containing protein [Dolichospermum sp.]
MGVKPWAMIRKLHLVLSATLLLMISLFFLGDNLTVSAATMAEIEQRGYLNLAVKNNLRPLGFRDVKGNLQGLEIDLAKHLASDLLGKVNAVKLQPVANSDRLPVVFNQQVDLAVAGVTATASRSRIVSFSVPYYYDGAAIATKNTSIQELRDVGKSKIAVLNYSSTIYYLKYFTPSAQLIAVHSYREGWEKIENNQVDGFAADFSVLSGWVQAYPEYHILPAKLSTEPLSVVMPKGLQYDELRRKVNEAIARYTVAGWLKERIKYWGL